MHQSGFIVAVPEAEPRVASLRNRFHPVAKLGVPAHVTLLFPFMAPERIDENVLQTARDAIAGVKTFEFTLAHIGRFPETTYLAPTPKEPFIALTQRLAVAFPDFPPFGGEFDTIIPHLTVGHGSARSAELAEAELSEAMVAGGPIHSACSSIVLLENSSGLWKQIHVFPLSKIAGSVNEPGTLEVLSPMMAMPAKESKNVKRGTNDTER